MTNPYNPPGSLRDFHANSKSYRRWFILLIVMAAGISACCVLFQVNRSISYGKSPFSWTSVAGYLFYGDAGFLLAGLGWWILVASTGGVSKMSASMIWAYLGCLYAIACVMVICPVRAVQDMGGILFAASYIISTFSFPFCVYSCMRFCKSCATAGPTWVEEIIASSVVTYHGLIWGVLFTVPLFGL